MLSRAQVKEISDAINTALEAVADNNNLSVLRVKNATFDPTSGNATFKVECISGDGLSEEAVRYDRAQEMYNLPKRGTVIAFHGKAYTIKGINKACSKVIVSANGISYLLPIDIVCLVGKE